MKKSERKLIIINRKQWGRGSFYSPSMNFYCAVGHIAKTYKVPNSKISGSPRFEMLFEKSNFTVTPLKREILTDIVGHNDLCYEDEKREELLKASFAKLDLNLEFTGKYDETRI